MNLKEIGKLYNLYLNSLFEEVDFEKKITYIKIPSKNDFLKFLEKKSLSNNLIKFIQREFNIEQNINKSFTKLIKILQQESNKGIKYSIIE